MYFEELSNLALQKNEALFLSNIIFCYTYLIKPHLR